MSNPRFSPRRYIKKYYHFGRISDPSWLTEVRSDDERDRLAAAQLQHYFALRIFRQANRKFRSLKAYADECGVPYDRLAKVMRGEVIMRLEDIVQAERILGGILTTNPSMSPSVRRIKDVEARNDRQES